MNFRIPPSGPGYPNTGKPDPAAPSSIRPGASTPKPDDGTWTLRKMQPEARASQSAALNPHTFKWSPLVAPVTAISVDGVKALEVAKWLNLIRTSDVIIGVTESYARQGDVNPPKPDGARSLTYTLKGDRTGATNQITLEIDEKNKLSKFQIDQISNQAGVQSKSSRVAYFGMLPADAFVATKSVAARRPAWLDALPTERSAPQVPRQGTGGVKPLTHAALRQAALAKPGPKGPLSNSVPNPQAGDNDKDDGAEPSAKKAQ